MLFTALIVSLGYLWLHWTVLNLFSYFMVIADVDIFESIGDCDRPLQL